MTKQFVGILTVCVLLLAPAATTEEIKVSKDDWPWWRGLSRDGIANPAQSLPGTWRENENVLWKTAVPGRGHASPTIVGDRVFLASADENEAIQWVLCYDRGTGEELWRTAIHEKAFKTEGRQGHPRATKASCTIASDGHRIFVNFIGDDAVHTSAIDFEGKILWQKKLTDYTIHQGFGSSPAVYGPLVIAGADNKGGGALVGFDRETGDVVWSVKRHSLPNYPSPIILKIAGNDQLVLSGQDHVTSYDPLTGALNWEMEGATTECVTSVVSDGTNIVTSGGYPENHISVVAGDGSGETVWRNDVRVYVPSMIVHDGHLYGVSDGGEVFCYTMDSSTPVWRERLRGKFAASLVLVGDALYATSDKGKTFVFKASPEGLEVLAENTIAASDLQATPAYCGSRIYMRLARNEDDARQEYLYCIGAK